jgi:glucans biosynthesis protein C
VPRLIFLDYLRITVLLILVCFHVGMVYGTWVFHIKSPVTSHTPEVFMLLSAPWRMSVLFLVSGAAAWFYLQKTPVREALWQRTKRLLAPLLCAVVLIVPPQSYIEVMYKYAYTGSYAEFLKLYFAGTKQFCGLGPCLILPTWNHLWFLPYLWLYTVLLCLALRVWSGLHLRAPKLLAAGKHHAFLLLLPLVLLLLSRLLLARAYPQSYDVVHDWFSHSQYFMMFLLGALFAARADMWSAIAKIRWWTLGLALLAWVLLLVTRSLWWFSLEQWTGVLAALGFAYQLGNREHPWRRWLSDAVFPVYLFHQTWIIVLVWYLRPLALKPALEAPLVVVATLLLSVLSYLLVKRLPWGRTWFGVARAV